MGSKINFNIDKFQLIEESENSQLSKLRMWICSEGDNRHSIPISWEAIQDAKSTLVGKPVLAYHDKIFDKLGGHDKDEVAVGVFLREEDIFEETDEEGKRWIGGDAWLWKKYYPEIIEILKRNGGTTPISMEIEVLDGKNNGKGFEDINLFSFMGVTLIGCEPAIPNARGEVLKFSSLVEETRELISEKHFASGYKGIDFSIPKQVKDNSQNGLSRYEKNKNGGNPYSLSTARYIVREKAIEPSRVKKLYNSLLSGSKKDLNDDNALTLFMLLGGKECLNFCEDIMKQMDDADSGKLSHFTLKASDGGETEESKLKKDEMKDKGKEQEDVKEEKPFAEEVKPEEEKMSEDAPEKEPVEEKMAETPAEETKEPAEEESKETPSEEDSEEARMSLNAYADVTATLALLEMETDKNENLGSQYVSPEAGKQFSIMVSKIKELYEQNITLKEFKASVDQQNFAKVVNSTLDEIKDVVPPTQIEEFRKDSANFSLETISVWENKVKASAFTFAKEGKFKEEKKDDVVRMSLPFSNLKSNKEETLWG